VTAPSFARTEALGLSAAETATPTQTCAAAHLGRYGSDALASCHLKRPLAGETGACIAPPDPAG
jgi:hypothetical protein